MDSTVMEMVGQIFNVRSPNGGGRLVSNSSSIELETSLDPQLDLHDVTDSSYHWWCTHHENPREGWEKLSFG